MLGYGAVGAPGRTCTPISRFKRPDSGSLSYEGFDSVPESSAGAGCRRKRPLRIQHLLKSGGRSHKDRDRCGRASPRAPYRHGRCARRASPAFPRGSPCGAYSSPRKRLSSNLLDTAHLLEQARVAPPGGLEPPAFRLEAGRSVRRATAGNGGGAGIRTQEGLPPWLFSRQLRSAGLRQPSLSGFALG